MAKRKAEKFFYGTGRRKTSVARVYLYPTRDSGFLVNGRAYDKFFKRDTLRIIVRKPLEEAGLFGDCMVQAVVKGGGISGQAGAVRHGLAGALVGLNEELKAVMRRNGFLTRDARQVERKKVGLHKARKRPQYSKR